VSFRYGGSDLRDTSMETTNWLLVAILVALGVIIALLVVMVAHA